MKNKTTKEFLEEISSEKPAPGGGSVAADAGAKAAALIVKAAKKSNNRKLAQKAERFMNVLLSFIDKDAEAFVGGNMREATEIPLQTAGYSFEVLKLARVLIKDCNPRLVSDVGVAVKMAEAAVEGALLNVKVNLAKIKDEEYQREILEATGRFYLVDRYVKIILDQVQARLS